MRVADTKRISMADSTVEATSLLNPPTFPTGGPRSGLVCPRCNRENDSIGRHFAQSTCGYPLLTQDEASALAGAWLVGAFVNPPENRKKTPRLIIRADSEKRITLAQKYLGICGRDSFKMSNSERYQLNTVPHPKLSEFYVTSRDTVSFTRRMAQMIYILRGEEISDECLRFKTVIDPDAFIKALDSVGLTGVEIKPKVVDIQGKDAEAFKSWASLKTIHSKLK